MRLDQVRAEVTRLAQTRAASRASCPDPERLRTAADLSMDAPARAIVLDHVTRCHACRREFDLLRTVAVAGRELDRGSAWQRVVPYAAAAVLVLGVGLTTWLAPGDNALRTGRDGAPIEIIGPRGTVAARGAFDRRLTWRSAGPNARYAVTLLREGLPLVRYGDLGDTLLTLADSVRLDPPARYEWYVEATQDGRRVRSAVAAFSLR